LYAGSNERYYQSNKNNKPDNASMLVRACTIITHKKQAWNVRSTANQQILSNSLFLPAFMAIFSQALFAFMGRDFMSFSFFTARHNLLYFKY